MKMEIDETYQETYLDIERREKNKIIKDYQLEVKRLTLKLSALRSQIQIALDISRK